MFLLHHHSYKYNQLDNTYSIAMGRVAHNEYEAVSFTVGSTVPYCQVGPMHRHHNTVSS